MLKWGEIVSLTWFNFVFKSMDIAMIMFIKYITNKCASWQLFGVYLITAFMLFKDVCISVNIGHIHTFKFYLGHKVWSSW